MMERKKQRKEEEGRRERGMDERKEERKHEGGGRQEGKEEKIGREYKTLDQIIEILSFKGRII